MLRLTTRLRAETSDVPVLLAVVTRKITMIDLRTIVNRRALIDAAGLLVDAVELLARLARLVLLGRRPSFGAIAPSFEDPSDLACFDDACRRVRVERSNATIEQRLVG